MSAESSGSSIGLDDFVLMRVIGRGSYAKVFVVEQKSTKRAYAMKVIKKELVNDDEVTMATVLPRQLLLLVITAMSLCNFCFI